MAQQESIIKLKGRIGDLTFFKTKGGYQARQKTGVSGERIATDPKFQRTRENGAEFGRACKAGKLVRLAFKQLIVKGADRSMNNRLTRLFSQIIKADSVNTRGQRTVLDAEAEMLQGFEFNSRGVMSTAVSMPFISVIDREGGSLRVSFPAFKPAEMISAPQGATHFRFKTAGSVVDFEAGLHSTDVQTGEMLSLDAASVPAFELNSQVTPDAVRPILLVLGIEFFQLVNGEEYLLNNGGYNGLAIIQVDGGA